MFYNPPHRTKSAPLLGAKRPGDSGPFGPWGADEDQEDTRDDEEPDQ